MAKVKITGHASGTGILTVTAPNTSTDRTITLPDSTGTLATTADAFDPDGAVVFNESSADADFRIESNGNADRFFVNGGDNTVLFGTQISQSIADTFAVQIFGTTQAEAGLAITRNSNNNGYPNLAFAKSRNTTPGSHTIVQDNDYLGWITWFGDDGTDLATPGAAIGARIDGTPGANDMPTKLLFHTTPNGTNDTVERLAILNDGRGLSQFTAKAWINLDGTGTIAIRDSHNVSSITDTGSGSYTVTFSNAMANANYSVVASGGDFSGGGTGGNHWVSIGEGTAQSTTAFYPRSLLDGGGWNDTDMINCIVFGD